MKTAQTRVYISGNTEIEIKTFLMEDGEDVDDFLNNIKMMYPNSEIRIPGYKTVELIFLKKLKSEPIRKSEQNDEDFWTKVNEEDEPVKRKKKR